MEGWQRCNAVPYYVSTDETHTPMRVKLKDTTFILGDKPMKQLLWCNKVPKGKRNKPAKINGIQHHEISDSAGDDFVAIEHTYYQPVN